jgi:hypothetical protein
MENSMQFYENFHKHLTDFLMEFHEMYMEFNGIPLNFVKYSMEFSMEIFIEFHGIPWKMS